MIVFDDIVYSLQRAGGISEYWSQLGRHKYNSTIHYYYDNAVNNVSFEKIDGSKYIELSSKGLGLRRFLNLQVPIEEPFIFHSSYFRICNNKNALNVVTIYDYIYEYYRKDLKSLGQKWQKKYAINKSDAVICISNSTKKDLYKFNPTYKGIVKVIHCGYDSDSFTYVNKGERESIILFIGSRKGYKRFDLAVQLLKLLPESYRMIIAGGGDFSDEELHLLSCVGNRYEKKGFVKTEELAQLYNRARFLCYPSDYEGFGIPPIEAQACGCVPIYQDTSSLHEVMDGTGIIIDKYDIKKTVQEIECLDNETLFRNKQMEGFNNIKRFSWDKCRKETFELYAELINNNRQ